MNEDQIYFLVCQRAMGCEVFWRGNAGWREIGLIADREQDDEWKARILDGSTDHYIDLYNVDVDDLMVVTKMNVDWQNPPKAAWAKR